MSDIIKPPGYRRGISGQLSSFEKIQFALQLLEKRKIEKERLGSIPRNLTYAAIALKVGIYSPNTISRWDHSDMSLFAINGRLANKAAKSKFSTEEERILSGWVIYKDLTFESSTTFNFSEFVLTYFGRAMSPSFITKFMKRNHLSLKQVGNAKRSELLDSTIDSAVSFLETLETVVSDYHYRPDQIKVFDKTYLMTSPWHKFVKHMSAKGENKPRKQTCDRGDGMIYFFFFSFSFSFLFLLQYAVYIILLDFYEQEQCALFFFCDLSIFFPI
jgi:hypothetical protein